MKKISLFIFLCFAVTSVVLADNVKEENSVKERTENTEINATCSLQGTVYDPVCNEAISGATITINGKKYYSDLSGNFSIPALPKGKYTVSVDFISYQQQTMVVDLEKNRNLQIKLKQQ